MFFIALKKLCEGRQVAQEYSVVNQTWLECPSAKLAWLSVGKGAVNQDWLTAETTVVNPFPGFAHTARHTSCVGNLMRVSHESFERSRPSERD
jgi:hypothetical protein